MDAAKLLSTDTKVSVELAERIVKDLNGLLKAATTTDDLARSIDQKTPSAYAQYLVAHALVNMTEVAGKHRGGTPTLADEILDQQVSKIKRYGKSTYRLTEKQLEVIVRDSWQWLRPEMRQGV